MGNLAKMAGLALLAAGAVAIYFGYQSSQSVANKVSEAFTGRSTDQTLQYYVGGAVLIALGVGALTAKLERKD